MKYERDFIQLFQEASGSSETKKHLGAAIKNNISRLERKDKSKERKIKEKKEKLKVDKKPEKPQPEKPLFSSSDSDM
jgi:hypothetical protein